MYINGWTNACEICQVKASEGLEYAFNAAKNGYVVTGIGTCTDTVLIIPQTYEGLPVTQIGDNAFAGNTTITGLKTTGNVLNIGVSAFEYCTALEKVLLSDDVKYICEEAFRGCSNLTEFVTSDCLEILEGYSFAECSALKAFDIPHGVERLEEGVFYYCKSLESMVFPESLTEIWSNVFFGCSKLKSVSFGRRLDMIGEKAFTNAGVETVCVQSLTTWCQVKIGDWGGPFRCAENADTCLYVDGELVTDLAIPDGVEEIGNETFACCNSIVSVTIPASVKSIGTRAFGYCYKLKEVSIANGVQTLGESAFIACNLAEIKIPDSVTEIGAKAFSGCRELTNVSIGNGIKRMGNDVFSKSSNPIPKKIIYNEYAGGYYLGNEENPYVVLMYVGGDFTEIHEETRVCVSFSGGALTDLVIPDSVISIMRLPDNTYSGLKSMTIGKSVEYIGGNGYSLAQPERLIIRSENIEFEGLKHGRSLPSYQAVYIEMHSNLIPIVFVVESGYYGGQNAEEIKITGGKEIPAGAFRGFKNVKKITLPETLRKIGASAFSYCENLAELDIPESVREIGEYAFSECKSLTTLNIPELVTKIEQRTFQCCEKLRKIVIPDLVTEIGEKAFDDCKALKNVIMPKGVTSIGGDVFSDCIALTHIYYKGTAEEWDNISIAVSHDVISYLTASRLYYYSEKEPALSEDGTAYEGNFWHYDENGEVVVWTKESV